MSASPKVLVACDDLILLDEVIRHLEEIPHWRLLRSAGSVDELLRLGNDADCILLSGAIAPELAAHPRAGRLSPGVVVFGRQESTEALRAGLRLGARGFILWPDEQSQLRELVEAEAPVPEAASSSAGALHAVWAPKGGAGASVVAANLAGAFAISGRSAVLVDLDLDHGDQTALLGAEPSNKSVGDLLRVADELSAKVVQSVLWSHPIGFRAVLSPAKLGQTGASDGAAVGRVLRAIRETAQNVVVDLPSGLNPVARAGFHEATSISVVLTPDLLGLRRARDLLESLNADGVSPDKIDVVLNQAGGPDITAKEVEAVLGVAAVTRVRADLQIYRAANRGELSPLACKMLSPLAKRLASLAGAPLSAAPKRAVALKTPASPVEKPAVSPQANAPANGSWQPAPHSVQPRRTHPVRTARGIGPPESPESRRRWPVKSQN
jgi:Flp pilus assembly CpaE family ATPase